MRISTLDRDLDEYFHFAPPNRPPQWDSARVKQRLIFAFEVERKIPGRPGPALLRNTWKLRTIDSFADKVAQGESPRREILEQWARAGGASALEVSLMDESFGWVPQALCNGRLVEGKCLLAWAHSKAGGPPLRGTIRRRGWSRSTFLKRVEAGAEAIAAHLRAHDVPVR